MNVIPTMFSGADAMSVFRNELFQNYPNPFNPNTTIEYSVTKNGFVELEIYNVLGQNVRTLVRGNEKPGSHKAIWDGRDSGGRRVSTGLYFCHLKVNSFISVKK